MKKKRWDVLLSLLPHGSCVFAEIGVWRGELSGHLLSRHPNLLLLQVDRWTVYGKNEQEPGNIPSFDQSMFDEAFSDNFKSTHPYKDRVTLYHMDSLEAARKVPDGYLDGVFIDAGHRYEAVRSDILAWLPKVSDGGFISGHDYPRRQGVKDAVDEIFGNPTVYPDQVWWVRVDESMVNRLREERS